MARAKQKTDEVSEVTADTVADVAFADAVSVDVVDGVVVLTVNGTAFRLSREQVERARRDVDRAFMGVS